MASSSHSNTRAGPRNLRLGRPATFTIAPSGASVPFSPTTPPQLVIGLLVGRTTSWPRSKATPARFSAIVLPVTVMQSPCR